MLSENFNWEPGLPDINENNPKQFINKANKALSKGIKNVFEKDLKSYVKKNKIKRFKRIETDKKTIDKDKKAKDINKIGLIDLTSNNFSDDFLILEDLGYEIAIKHKSPIEPIKMPTVKNPQIDWARRENRRRDIANKNSLIKLPVQWEIIIHRIKVKSLKTQDNVSIIFSLGINSSKIDINLSNKTVCNHEFRLFDIGLIGFGWELVWECVNCGFLCHCECFKDAIKTYKKNNKDLNKRNNKKAKENTGVDISNLPFHKNACEVCRDKPSSHKFGGRYTRSEFEIRYGAYIRKKYYELKANKYPPLKELSSKEIKRLKRKANNLMREKLGFKKIGKQFVTETELYRIVDSIFSDKEVIHHYRSDWLGKQELDIFIPKLNLGIEYHGKQHFEPIEAWGGEKGLKENRKRDKRKKQKCKNNGIKLAIFTYKEKDRLNKQYVLERINSI